MNATSFEEVAVEPGQRITVQGVAFVDVDPGTAAERGYRDPPPVRIRVVAGEQHPLTIGT